MRKTRIIVLKMWIALLIFIVGIATDYIYSVEYLNKRIKLTYYTVDAFFPETIRIIQLTDLHNRQFGKHNQKLIKSIKDNNPDLIVMTGDMVDADEENPKIVYDLINDVEKIAPVYYSYGNHEYDWEEKWNKKLTPILEKSGAIVLEDEFQDVVIKDNRLRIGGYYGYYRRPHMVSDDEEYMQSEKKFCESFENTDSYKILLSHIPTAWLDWKCINDYPVDIVFCGHYHGGLVRIPIINKGLYAPYVGWFPPYTQGLYEGKRTRCILSTGLGDEHGIPRINNPPEIVVTDLLVK